MATSAVGRCQQEGRLGPGRGDADGDAPRRHRRKAADPLVAHHGKGGDGASVRLDAAGLDVLAEGQVFPQDKAGNCLTSQTQNSSPYWVSSSVSWAT